MSMDVIIYLSHDTKTTFKSQDFLCLNAKIFSYICDIYITFLNELLHVISNNVAF